MAAQAGVAKKTVYRHASNREELVGLAVREWTDGFAPQLQRDAHGADEVLPLLQDILQAVCTQALSAQAVQVFRLLATDFPGKDALLQAYLDNGIERGRALLADWLNGSSSVGCCVRGFRTHGATDPGNGRGRARCANA